MSWASLITLWVNKRSIRQIRIHQRVAQRSPHFLLNNFLLTLVSMMPGNLSKVFDHEIDDSVSYLFRMRPRELRTTATPLQQRSAPARTHGAYFLPFLPSFLSFTPLPDFLDFPDLTLHSSPTSPPPFSAATSVNHFWSSILSSSPIFGLGDRSLSMLLEVAGILAAWMGGGCLPVPANRPLFSSLGSISCRAKGHQQDSSNASRGEGT